MSGEEDSAVSASLRTLILMLNLVNTRLGVSQETLLRLVPGYQHLKPASAERAFERDIDSLRRAGFIIEVDEPRGSLYRIAKASFAASDQPLTKEQKDLVLRAGRAWEKKSGLSADSIRYKMAGQLPSRANVQPSYNLESGADLQVMLDAIERKKPLQFRYASKRGTELREVAPYRLIARRQALYLWAFDLNRWDERLFRLSRFRSTPTIVEDTVEVDAAMHLPSADFQVDRFLVEPILLVNKTRAPSTYSMTSPADLPQDEASPLPSGWSVRVGRADDIAFWQQQILREAGGVIPRKPHHLRRIVKDALTAGADLGPKGELDG